jgi:hypothetical protein
VALSCHAMLSLQALPSPQPKALAPATVAAVSLRHFTWASSVQAAGALEPTLRIRTQFQCRGPPPSYSLLQHISLGGCHLVPRAVWSCSDRPFSIPILSS